MVAWQTQMGRPRRIEPMARLRC